MTRSRIEQTSATDGQWQYSNGKSARQYSNGKVFSFSFPGTTAGRRCESASPWGGTVLWEGPRGGHLTH